MPDVRDSHSTPLQEMVADAERELQLRLSVYPRLTWLAKMTQRQADRQIRVQRAIVETLRNCADARRER